MDDTIEKIFNSILNGESGVTPELVQTALESGYDPTLILNDGMTAAMSKVGELFEAGEYYVPEMLIAARAMKAGMVVLKPSLMETNVQSAGKIAIGTVKGDLHDIGKSLVGMMLEGAAFEIIDLGSDVTPERFVMAVKESGAQILAMSALLTTTIGNMRATINALKESGLRDQVKVIVGGAPLTNAFADEIGADGYAPDASRGLNRGRETGNRR